MTDFASHLRGLRRSDSTVRDYTGDVERYSAWHQARHGSPAAVTTINRVDVNEWLREQSEADVAPATMNRRLASLKAWVRWGQETDQIDERHDPLARVHGFKTQNVGPRWLQRTARAGCSAPIRAAWRARLSCACTSTANGPDHSAWLTRPWWP